ncbi:hypothetical protein [Micromonospora sp. NPDC050495]|uniref:hypothetical protein n=1 Tax=Micromonospora sp. NPDC050495 TaxID=3154936 RepID=UPI0033DF64C6
MALAYFLGGGLNERPGMGREMYERHSSVRRWYAQVGEWTGLSPEWILDAPSPPEREFRTGVGAIRQAAFVFAVADLLAESGVSPSVVGGISLGSLIGCCLAGALDRAALFALLDRVRNAPPPAPGAPAEAIATVFFPREFDEALLEGPARPGVHIAADLGQVRGSDLRLLILAGYRAALEELAAEAPGEMVTVLPDHPVAFHSPLQQPLRDFLEPYIAGMPLRDPAIPICTGTSDQALRTAKEVRQLFLDNFTHPVSNGNLMSAMAAEGVRLGLALGPSRFDRVDRAPFPTVRVELPDDLPEALSAVYDHGIAPTGTAPC